MHLHADTSTTFVIFREILNALNPFEKKEDDLHFQKLGLILALFAIVAGFFCNYVYPKREKGSEWSSVQFSKAKLPDSGFEFAPVMFHTKGTSQQPVYSPIPEQCVLIAPNKTVVIKMRYHVKLSNYEDTEGVQLLDTSTGRWGVSTWTQVNNSTLGMKEPFINEVIVGVKGVPSLSKESFICL